jgi:hypothetical protein
MLTDAAKHPVSRPRRALLAGGALLAGAAIAGVTHVATHSNQPISMDSFSDLGHTMRTLERLREASGVEHLMNALRLAPHFAYGALSKSEYTRAHLMDLANHWERVDVG